MNTLGGQSLFSNFLWLGTSTSGWTILFILGIGPTIGGYGLYLVSLNYLPATVANLIGSLEPAFTAIWAYFLLNEQLTFIQIVGSLLVFASVILLRLGEGRGSSRGYRLSLIELNREGAKDAKKAFNPRTPA